MVNSLPTISLQIDVDLKSWRTDQSESSKLGLNKFNPNQRIVSLLAELANSGWKPLASLAGARNLLERATSGLEEGLSEGTLVQLEVKKNYIFYQLMRDFLIWL